MISEQIDKEIKEVKDEPIEANPDYAPSHKDLVDLIYLYENSKHRDGDKDSEGYKRWFFNISDYRRKVVSKAIDLDSKGTRIIPEEGHNPIVAYMMENDLRQWIKDSQYGLFLNEVKDEFPTWGSVVAKKFGKNEIDTVNLRNLYPDPYTKRLKDGRFIIEEHRYSLEEFEEEANKKGWNNWKQAIDLSISNKSKEIVMYERYGLYKENKEDPVKYTKHLVVYQNNKEIILDEDEIKREDIPYKELHGEKKRDRWLSKGTIEDLFENQIAQNQVVNLKRKGMEWASKYIFQSADSNIAGNQLVDVVNGTVLLGGREGIRQVPIDERNLASYQDELNRWDLNADRKQFTHDIIRGETMNSGTTLGQARIQTAMATSYFDTLRENFGLFLKEILSDWIVPTFCKESNAEHWMNFVGEPSDIEKFDKMALVGRWNNAVMDYVKRNGGLPTADQAKIMQALEVENIRSNRPVKIPEGFYKGLKYKINIVITGESIDLGAKAQVMRELLNIAINPGILQNPITRKAFYKMMEYAGISSEEFEFETGMPDLMDMVTKETGRRAKQFNIPAEAKQTMNEPVSSPAEATI